MSTEFKEIAPKKDNRSFTSDLAKLNNQEISVIASFIPETQDEKKTLYNALNSSDEALGDHINETIMLTDVVLAHNEIVNEENGEISNVVRCILLDDKDITYGCVASGVYKSICNIHAIFGTLHFTEPLPVTIRQVKVKRGSTLTLVL